MDEFDISEIEALTMGTPVNKLKSKSINMENFIKDVEHELSNVSEISSLKYNPNINYNQPSKQPSKHLEPIREHESIEDIIKNKHKDEDEHEHENNNVELLIFIVLFILLNNKFFVDIVNSIPYVNINDNMYPNLIIRSIIFGFIIYTYKKYYTNNI